jgi:hypothetical protein
VPKFELAIRCLSDNNGNDLVFEGRSDFNLIHFVSRYMVCVALSLCLFSLAMYGQKTRFGQSLPYAKQGVDYPIQIHISGTHYRVEYIGSGQAENAIYADAVMNGKKIELEGERSEIPFQSVRLSLGDYRMRLLKDPKKMGACRYSRNMRFSFPIELHGVARSLVFPNNKASLGPCRSTGICRNQ